MAKVPAKILHSKLTVSLSIITHYLRWYFETMHIPCFCLNFGLLILAPTDGSCLQQLLQRCSISLIPSTCITWNSSGRQSCIFPSIYLYLYGLTDTYFILWLRIQYYCDLPFFSSRPTSDHWDLFQVNSYAFLISPYLVFLSFHPSEGGSPSWEYNI